MGWTCITAAPGLRQLTEQLAEQQDLSCCSEGSCGELAWGVEDPVPKLKTGHWGNCQVRAGHDIPEQALYVDGLLKCHAGQQHMLVCGTGTSCTALKRGHHYSGKALHS